MLERAATARHTHTVGMVGNARPLLFCVVCFSPFQAFDILDVAFGFTNRQGKGRGLFIFAKQAGGLAGEAREWMDGWMAWVGTG